MSNPYLIKEPTCISFSGGRTSAFMLHKVLEANGGLPPDAKVCFCNTGKEHQSTYDFVHRCSLEWNVEIVWLEYISGRPGFKVVDYESASRNGEPFEALIRDKQILPNNFMRFCTEWLKVRLVFKYLKSMGLDIDEENHFVGIRADEPRRVAKVGLGKCPLAKDGITEEHIKQFWENNNFDLELPIVGRNKLSNCDLCFMKGDATLISIVQHEPWRADWWIRMEEENKKSMIEKVGHGNNATFRKNSISYAQMLKYQKDQMTLFTDDNAISCFCGD